MEKSRLAYKAGGGSYATPSGPEGGTGHLTIANDAASVRSQDAAGGFANGEPPIPRGYYRSSGKVHELADEISSMEQRYTWLQQRNAYLTQKMLSVQKSFISQTLMSGTKFLRRKCYNAWRDVMSELRLEHQLEEQTRSLDQCQQVARELGTALADEQNLRQDNQADHESVQEEVNRILAGNDGVRQKIDKQQAKIDALEARLQTAEMYIAQGRGFAIALVEEGNSYDKRKKEIERLQMDSKDVVRAEQRHYTMEESSKLREEAQEVVHKAQTLLPTGAVAPRSLSPERAGIQPGAMLQQSTSSSYQPHRIGTSLTAPAPRLQPPTPARKATDVEGLTRKLNEVLKASPVPLPRTDRFSAWQTNEAAGSAADAIFDAMDTNHDGIIDRDEFTQYEAKIKAASPALSRATTGGPKVAPPDSALGPYLQTNYDTLMSPTAGLGVAVPPPAIQPGVRGAVVAPPVGTASPMIPGGSANFMLPRTPILPTRQPAQAVIGGINSTARVPPVQNLPSAFTVAPVPPPAAPVVVPEQTAPPAVGPDGSVLADPWWVVRKPQPCGQAQSFVSAQ